MVTVDTLYETSRVCVRRVTIPPGESLFLQLHNGQHSLAIPLRHLEDNVPYEVLVNYLLHHVPAKQYYSLHNTPDAVDDEQFVQLLWSSKPRAKA